ncbi:ATP-binding protein [Nonomuraea sp. NPDC004297]
MNDAARRAAADLWEHEQAAARLTRFHKLRPAAFASPGTLHPDIAVWADHVAVGHYGNLVLVSGTGVGKSWSLWAAAERLITSGWRSHIEIVPARTLKKLITPPVDEAALARLAAAGLLAIDDIGSMRVSDWDSDHTGALIDERSENCRPTALTSNQLDLRAILGDRAASRLAHHAAIVQMTGPDRRRTA